MQTGTVRLPYTLCETVTTDGLPAAESIHATRALAAGARFINRLPAGIGISVIVSASLYLSVSLTTYADMVDPP
ncbi:unnamed protein product [Heligmosomoides polygyrus]|uniref:Aa_trans domain-containing protein n=1 Tax=Heligmosomoides polygyrus TaxID=6339 RepID=A0A183GAC4_HELPZ|nr:unnamed protein product [Heligmosomoides polygyrus]